MATFIVTDPQTGRKIKLTGDSAPTEQELNDIFASLQPEQQAQPQELSFVPTEEALARERAPKKDEPGFVETVKGIGEAALTAVTGATTGALGFGLGTLEGAVGELVGRIPRGEGVKKAQALAESLTFTPKTEVGRDIITGFGEALGSLPPTIIPGSLPVLQTLAPTSRFLSAKLLKNPRLKRKLLADEIRKGNPNIDLVTKTLNESGEIITNKAAKKVVKVLGGDTKAQQTVSVLENLNPESKAKVNKMLDIIEKGRREPLFGQTNRPSDILGESVANRARKIATINKEAGTNINKAAKKLKGINIRIEQPMRNFFNEMQELGVKFENVEGRIKLDFTDSLFTGGGKVEIERISNFIKNGFLDGEKAHQIKQFTRDLVEFGKGTESAVSARSQGVLKRLASGIDDALDSKSKTYKKANEAFAKTIELKNQFDKLAGKDVDIFSDLSPKALGGKARRLVSNAESRVAIEQTLLEADRVLADFNIRFKDDIPSLSFAVTQFENIFKIEPAGSFQGRIQRAGVNVLEASGSTISAAKLGLDKLISLTAPDFDTKMKALRLLVKERK